MISSGIKRGLAATAISALAVTGLPALAGSASAAPGDSFTITYTGPVLNGGTQGGVVVLRALDGTIDETQLDLTSTSSPTAGSEDTADQQVDIVGRSVANDPTNSNYDLITLNITVTTPADGQTATYRIFEDEDTDGTLDAGEARQTSSQTTSGPVATIDVAPATQSSPQNVPSGPYTVTLKDSAGRTTQLDSGETVVLTHDVNTTTNESGDVITADEIERGTDTFTATGSTVGAHTINLDSTTVPARHATATLNVTQAATLTAANLDIVTAADTWHGFGNNPDSDGDSTTTYVRVDQNTVRFDFDAPSSQAGANVLLAVDGFGGVTFAGQDQAAYTTTLDANGNGSITVTADAATIQDGDGFDVDINGFDQEIVFQRAEASSIDGESATYFCQDDAACTVTAVVLDQFGNPVTTGEVAARRTGPQNVDAAPQRKPVGSDGTVDFTFTDANPVDGGTDTVQFDYFVDQFDNTPDLTDTSTTIKYSATGQGSDYVIGLDGNNTEAPGYKPSDAAIIPLTDTVADQTVNPEDEDAVITITGGEALQAVTLSVDNGALILAPGETNLSQGSASIQTALDGTGALAAGYRIIGTKSGPVTLSVDSAGRSETAALVVEAQDDSQTARNVTLTAPAEVPFGTTQITFTAVVTDAFGNPVPGVPNDAFNKQVTGPGQYQDGDAQTDANGQIKLNVRVDAGASGDITLAIDAADGYGQFGAEADRQFAYSVTDDGAGLTVSSDKATATTTVQGATPPPPPPTKVAAELTLKGHNEDKGATDVLFANADSQTAGGTVKLFKRKAGAWKLIGTGTMNKFGNHFFNVADKNGSKDTLYKAVVSATAKTYKGFGKKTLS